MRKRSDRILKVTLPSPSLLGNFWSAERSREIYQTLDDFLDDVAALVRGEVAELTHLGCRYVQLDAPHYPLLAGISDLPALAGPFIHPKAAQCPKLLFVTASSRFRGRQLSPW